jgi:CBS domain-containing protein
MAISMRLSACCRLYVDAATAEDLMMANPISISESATIREAVALLTDRGFSAAPVIDVAGRPVGVVSRTDIVRRDRESVSYAPAAEEYYQAVDPYREPPERPKEGFRIEAPDQTPVREIMTPVVFAVAPHTSVTQVIEEFLERKVHRLFVVDDSGALIGVISLLDILRCLRGEDEQ